MEKMDARLEGLANCELGAGDRLLAACAARAVVKPPVPGPLIPISIVGFALLSLATNIGLFAFMSLAVIVAVAVYFFSHYKQYVLAATETDLILIHASSNLLSRLDSRRLPYGKILLVTEQGGSAKRTGRRVQIDTAEESLKLDLIGRSPELASKLLGILREKVP